MNTLARMLRRSLLLLPLVMLWLLPGANTTVHAAKNAQVMKVNNDFLVDGTQLITETKAVVANLLHVSPSQVSASYCCQLFDGRFKYTASVGLQGGFVYWTVVDGQIIESDAEGF